MKLPAKPPTKVERLSNALKNSVTKDTWFQDNGQYFNVDGTIFLRVLAAELLGPDPVIMPSTAQMAAHMDEFYADSILDNAGVPTDDLGAVMQMYRDSEMCGSRPDFLTPRKG